MYYSELNDCIKYKIVRWPESILKKIVDKHNEKTWADVDYIIYRQDWVSCLLIEKTQEEIVKEIKDWTEKNIPYLKKKTNNVAELNWLIASLWWCKYVVDFESYEEYFTLSDIYPECFYTPKKYKPTIIKWQRVELPDIDEIKNIDILLVLDKCWVEYKKTWSNTYVLYENGKWTDWWRANTTQNIVSDFSWKWRPHWNPLNFAVEYLNLPVKETLLRFKEKIC